MLSLWSRATRTRSSCRCISCISATTTTGRRLATNAGRRQLRFGDYVYMFSTGIFASAAVADANVKEKRRNDLDTAIAEQRGKLGAWHDTQLLNVGDSMVEVSESERCPEAVEYAIHKCQANHTSSLGSSGPNNNQELLKDYKSWLRTKYAELTVEGGESGPAGTPTFTETLGSHRRQSVDSNTDKYPPDPTEEYLRTVLTGRTALRDHPDTSQWNMKHFAPQSIYAKEPSTIKPKQIWWPKKIRTVELSMAKLVHRLLLRLGPSGLEGATALQNLLGATSHKDLGRELDSLKSRLCLLMYEDQVIESPRFPRYNQDGDGDFRWETRELNSSLTSLFNRHLAEKVGFKTLITRVCYNLLACNAPPDINTYNLMIYFLGKMPQTQSAAGPMVQPVIDSLLETKIRPNETTYCIILHHYTNIGDGARLTKFVRLMTGHDEGLMLARPDIQITDAGGSRLIRREDKVIQVPTFDRDIFAALIRGTLKFSGIEAAMRVFKSMQMDGWSVNLEILYIFLRACSQLRDWEAGKAVWEEIVARKEAKNLGTQMYQWMLSLCWRCAKSNEFKDLYQEALAWGHEASDLLKYVTGAETLETDPWLSTRPHGPGKAEKESQCRIRPQTRSHQSSISTVGETPQANLSRNFLETKTINPKTNLSAGSVPILQFQQTRFLSHTSGNPAMDDCPKATGTQLARNFSAFYDVVRAAFDAPQPAIPTKSERSGRPSIPENLYQFVAEAAIAPLSLQVRHLDYQLLIMKHCFLEIHTMRTRRELLKQLEKTSRAVVVNVLTTEHQLRTLQIIFTKRAIRKQAAKVYLLDMADEATKSGLCVASLALDHINIHKAILGCSPQTSEFIYYAHAHVDTALVRVILPSGQMVDSWNKFKKWKKTFLKQNWTWFARQRMRVGLFAKGISRKTIGASKPQAIDATISPGLENEDKQLRIYFRGDKTMELLVKLRDCALSYGLTIVEKNDMGLCGGFIISRPLETGKGNEMLVKPLLMEPVKTINVSDGYTEDWSGPLNIMRTVTIPEHVGIRRVSVPSQPPFRRILGENIPPFRRSSSLGGYWSMPVPEPRLVFSGAAQDFSEPISAAS